MPLESEMPFLLVSITFCWVSHTKAKWTHCSGDSPRTYLHFPHPCVPSKADESLSILSHPSKSHIRCCSNSITKGEDLRKGDRSFPYVPVRNNCLLHPVCFSVLLERKLSLPVFDFLPIGCIWKHFYILLWRGVRYLCFIQVLGTPLCVWLQQGILMS